MQVALLIPFQLSRSLISLKEDDDLEATTCMYIHPHHVYGKAQRVDQLRGN